MEFDFMAAVNGTAEIVPVEPEASNLDVAQACRVLRRMYLPEIERMKAQAKAHVVTDEQSSNEAITMAGQAKKIASALEKERKRVIEKPGEFVKSVNNLAKAFKDSLDDIDRTLKNGIQKHLIKVQMEQREAQERARKAAAEVQRELDARAAELQSQREADARTAIAAGNTPEVIPDVVAPIVEAAVVPVQKVFRSETGSSVHLRKDWVWDVLDISLVPGKYLVVDKVSINQAVKSGIREIPGVRIYEVETAVIKA